MEVTQEFYDKTAKQLFRSLKVFLLQTCISDLQIPLHNYDPENLTDEQLIDLVERFSDPFIDKLNRLILRYIRKDAGVGVAELGAYETIVDELTSTLCNTTKAREILIYCMCSVAGVLREMSFGHYLQYMNENCNIQMKIIQEFSNFLKQPHVEDGFHKMLSGKIKEVYLCDLKFRDLKQNIQCGKFIHLDVNRQRILDILSGYKRESKNKHGIPDEIKSGFNTV